ncbi:hypothetical protein OTU49_015510 [Cherax quadricarinatus]|uniref:C-type lectin domain-containing protein n=2 Tax=Cherax quadricarinatus TaxID=27406 RepID=A0AAW0YE89_CHEQU
MVHFSRLMLSPMSYTLSWVLLLVAFSICLATYEDSVSLQEVDENPIASNSKESLDTCCCGKGGVDGGAAEVVRRFSEAVVTLLASSSLPDKAGVACPYPYTQVVNECFYAHQKKLTWAQARRVCQGMGGHLTEPHHSYALQAYLSETYGPGYFWVGGTDEGTEGSWRWVESGRPVDPTDWLFLRPDNRAGDEHCLEVVMSDYPGLYNDETCTVAQRFICQYKNYE